MFDSFLRGVDAAYSNKYLDKHVYNKKLAMEAKYGKGLYGMYGEDGRFNKESLVTPHSYYTDSYGQQQATVIIQFGNYQMNGQGLKAWSLGLVKGCEYQGLDVEEEGDKFYSQLMLSDCFVTTLALTETVEHTMHNIRNMFKGWGSIKLIEVIVHNATQVLGDIIVSYQ